MTPSLFRTLPMLALMTISACASPPGPESKEPAALTEKENNLLQLGLKVEKGGDTESAIGFYKKAMERSDGKVDGHLALSRVYIDQGKYLQAEEVLEKAKAVQSNNAEVNLRLGKIAIRRQQPSRAIAFFEDGLKELPGNVDLLNGKGVALDMMARHEEAQLQYRQALAGAKTQYPFVENNLAMSYIITGKYDEAIEVLHGITEVESSPVMRQNLALAYGLKGDMAKAREWGGRDLSEQEMNDNIAFYQNYVNQLQNEHEQAVPAPDVSSETLVPSTVTSGEIPTTAEVEPLTPAANTIAAPSVEKKIVPPVIVPIAPASAKTEIPVTPTELRNTVPAAPTVMSEPAQTTPAATNIPTQPELSAPPVIQDTPPASASIKPRALPWKME